MGVGDVLRPLIWKHLTQPKNLGADAGRVKFRYLAGIGRHTSLLKLGMSFDDIVSLLPGTIIDKKQAIQQAREALTDTMSTAANLPTEMYKLSLIHI